MGRTAALVAVVVLVVVDVVLGVLAWNHVHAGDGGSDVVEDLAGTAATTAATSGADPTSAGTSAPETTPTGTAGGETDPAPAYAAAVAEGELLARAPVRSCTEGATARVEVSEDGAESFAGFDTPLTSITGVAAPSPSELVVVGTDDQCEAAAVASTDGGESWESQALEDAGWSVVGEGRLISPAGELPDIGCTPAEVSGVSTEDAVVVCQDGLVLRTDNAGSFWGAQTTLPFATQVAFVSASDGYVVVSRDDCQTLIRATTDGGASWRDVQCISTAPPVGLAADGDTLVVVATDAVYRSEDRGENWQVR